MSAFDDGRDCGSLIRYALSRRRPTEGSDYAALIERYSTDATFRELTAQFVEGLGLAILQITRTGVVLAPTPDSPFAIRMSDLRANITAEEKLLFGLAVLGNAAWAYPNDVDLDAPDAKIVDIKSVDDFIRDAAARMPAYVDVAPAPAPVERTEPDAVDAAAAEQVLREGQMERARTAAQLYLNTAAYVPTDKKKSYRKGSTYWVLSEALGWLERQGMARPQEALGSGYHQLTDRFRILVGDQAISPAFEALTSLRRRYQPEPAARPAAQEEQAAQEPQAPDVQTLADVSDAEPDEPPATDDLADEPTDEQGEE